jgi:hypothetical protein
MSNAYRTEEERLVAEQAVAMYREVLKTMESAPHGHGMACMEAAVLTHGRNLMRSVLQQASSAHPEAQKGGPAADGARVETMPRSSTTRGKS